MKVILNCTGEQIIYNDYFKPFKCVANVDLPKMYNAGYNTYEFVGNKLTFEGVNMPEIINYESDNYIKYDFQIIVFRKNGTTVSGSYTKTINKVTNTVTEYISFN